MAKSVNIETRVNIVAKEMASGKSREQIFRKYGKKWGVSIRTVDKYATRARTVAEEAQRAMKKAEDEAAIEMAKDLEKRRILDRNERMEILSKIALGEIKIPDEEVKWDSKKRKFVKIAKLVEPSPEARKSAINELNKMDGNHAPVETNVNATIKNVRMVFPEGMKLEFPSNTE